jgi:hypothetical protein
MDLELEDETSHGQVRSANRPSRSKTNPFFAELTPMVKIVKSQSDHSTALRVFQQSGDIGPLVLPRDEDFSPAVTRAELDPSSDGPPSCGACKWGGYRPKRRGRCNRVPKQWCRLGERIAGSPRPLETKFG